MNRLGSLVRFRQLNLYERPLMDDPFPQNSEYCFRQIGRSDFESGALFQVKQRAQKFLKRMEDGHRCYGAIASDGQVASYAWTTNANEKASPPPFTGAMRLRVPKSVVYLWDCRTMEDHRNRGLYRDCLKFSCQEERNRGATRALISTDTANAASRTGIAAAGFRQVAYFQILQLGLFSIVHKAGLYNNWSVVKRHGILKLENPSGYNLAHIEVIGIGGAGKSTLLERLAERPDSVDIIYPPQPKSMLAIFHTGRLVAQVAVRAPIRTIACLTEFGGRLLFGKLGYRLAACGGLRGAKGILADSGFMEPLISNAIYFSGRSRPVPLQDVLATLPRPKAVLIVDCNTETAYTRFIERETSLRRLEAWGGSNGLRIRFEHAAERCAFIEQWCLRQGIAVFHIDCTIELSDRQAREIGLRLMRACNECTESS